MRGTKKERERENRTNSPFCMQSMQHFVSCNWSFRAGVEVKDKLIYFEAAAHRTERSIYVLANAPILYCPLAFKQNKAGTGGAQTDDDESEWKQNKNHTKVKATLWNPFIVHCQHALIKNASTFADSSVNCMQLPSHPLFTTLSATPSPQNNNSTKKRRGNECQLQFAVCRRGEAGAYPWYVIEEIPKIGLFDRTMSVRTQYNYRGTNTHVHTFICCTCVWVCEWVCKNSVALW